MLKKNIYITYPAGYMGTYINWIISVSDRDLRNTTVDNPLTDQNNVHAHIKYPTHINWLKTLTWIAKNRPERNLIYAINARKEPDYHYTPEYAIQNIARIDQTPVFINCHDSNQTDTMKFGALNMFTKWPTYIQAVNVWHNDYDPSMDCNIVRARNWLMQNWLVINPGNDAINPDIISYNLKRQADWYQVRAKTAPEEITESQYLIPDRVPEHILNIDLQQIVSADFIDLLESMLVPTDSGDFDFAYARKFHPTYLEHQKNTKWFDHVQEFRQRQTDHPWFYQNALSQAFLLLEIDQALILDLLHLETRTIMQQIRQIGY